MSISYAIQSNDPQNQSSRENNESKDNYAHFDSLSLDNNASQPKGNKITDWQAIATESNTIIAAELKKAERMTSLHYQNAQSYDQNMQGRGLFDATLDWVHGQDDVWNDAKSNELKQSERWSKMALELKNALSALTSATSDSSQSEDNPNVTKAMIDAMNQAEKVLAIGCDTSEYKTGLRANHDRQIEVIESAERGLKNIEFTRDACETALMFSPLGRVPLITKIGTNVAKKIGLAVARYGVNRLPATYAINVVEKSATEFGRDGTISLEGIHRGIREANDEKLTWSLGALGVPTAKAAPWIIQTAIGTGIQATMNPAPVVTTLNALGQEAMAEKVETKSKDYQLWLADRLRSVMDH